VPLPRSEITARHRLRRASQSGQATVEWIGVLVVVAVMVALGVKLGLGSAVAHGINRGVCTVLNEQHCGTGTSTTPTGPTSTDPPGPGAGTTTIGTGIGSTHPTQTTTAPTGPTHTGPVIGAGTPVPILPFNGATVSDCVGGKSGGDDDQSATGGSAGSSGTTGTDSGEGSGGEGSGGDEGDGAEGSVTLNVCDTIEADRGDPELTANCTETQQLSISSDLSATVQGEAKQGGTGASVTVGGGQKVNYELNVTPGQVAAMQSGSLGQPNPLDPNSIPNGDSIVLDQDTYKELDLGASYDDLDAALKYQQGHQISAGVKSLGNGEVQVDVGDSDLVQNSMELGVDVGGVGASIGDSDTQTYGKEYAVDINTDTPGGWATYQRFIHDGVLPTDADSGVSDSETSQVLTDESEAEAEAEAFGLSFGIKGTPTDLDDIQTTSADGAKTDTFNYRDGDVSEVVSTQSGTSGGPSTSGYQLLLHNVSPQSLENYEQLAGGNVQPTSNQDVSLSFSTAQLNNIQNLADADIAAIDKADGKSGVLTTAAGVKAAIAADPSKLLPGENLAPPIPLALLAKAKNPADILQELQNAMMGDASGGLADLENFQALSIEFAHPGIHDLLPYKGALAGMRICGASS
jgi:hypothetical protein